MCENMPPYLYAVPSELGLIRIPDASVSQQITRLLATDDWAILHSGHEMVTDVELDEIEGRGTMPVKRSRLVLNIDGSQEVESTDEIEGKVQ